MTHFAQGWKTDLVPRLAAAGQPVRKQGLVLRGYESLPVTVA